jgi:hypothetical protein
MKKTARRNRYVAHKLAVREEIDEGAPLPRISKKTKLHQDWEVNGVRVSDHAVVRYMEICLGLDVHKIRETMLADGRGEMVKRLQFAKMPIGAGKLVARKGVVVTVLKNKAQYNKGKDK